MNTINNSDSKNISDVLDVPKNPTEEQKKEKIALNVDNEEGSEENIHMQMRLGFIRKVYGILSLQLLITVLFCAATFYSAVKEFMLLNMALFWIAASLSIILIIPLICFKSIARKVPMNYIVLITWTICEAYIVGCCCALYDPQVVIMAAFATLAITVSITLYAITTKKDFTFGGGMLFSGLCSLLLLTLFSFIFPFLHTLICVFGVLLYSMYLLYDTQLIFGKVGLEYDVDDYILAALNIYLDIIQIFLYILEIIGSLSNN